MPAELAPVQTSDQVVAANVRARLAFLGVNDLYLAERLGFSRRTMYNKLHGITRWTAEEVADAARVFDTIPGALYEIPDGFPMATQEAAVAATRHPRKRSAAPGRKSTGTSHRFAKAA